MSKTTLLLDRTMTKYHGVIIYKFYEEIPGSSLRELKNGTLVSCKPSYKIYYRYSGSYPFDSVKKAKESIDNIMKELASKGITCTQREFEYVMNNK